MSITEASSVDIASAPAIEAEIARLFAAPQFARAPVMRRLLTYLIDQTLAGNGTRLKAYTIAVDGLGRDPDFDAKQDSYPRVQVGRLRQLLDDAYAMAGSRAGVRIQIPKGAYAVEFEQADEISEQIDHDARTGTTRADMPIRQWIVMAAIAVAAAFIAVATVHALGGAAGAGADRANSPVSAKPVADMASR